MMCRLWRAIEDVYKYRYRMCLWEENCKEGPLVG